MFVSQHNNIDTPKIFTIGFSGKSPDAFLEVLNAVRVRAVWDIRQWRTAHTYHFTVAKLWPRHWGDRYEYHPEFAPTVEILAGYKDGRITWPAYERMYHELLAACHPAAGIAQADIDRICLLCTEKSAPQCHRSLAAEYIAEQLLDIEIVHL